MTDNRPEPYKGESITDKMERQGWTGKRDWKANPPTLEEVKEWRAEMRKISASGRHITSWPSHGAH